MARDIKQGGVRMGDEGGRRKVRKFSERVVVRGGAKIIVYEMCPMVEKCVSGGGDCIPNRAEILKKFVYMGIICRGF